jgi:hypothetical protein
VHASGLAGWESGAPEGVRHQQAGSQNGCTQSPHHILHKRFLGALGEFYAPPSNTVNSPAFGRFVKGNKELGCVAATQQFDISVKLSMLRFFITGTLISPPVS